MAHVVSTQWILSAEQRLRGEAASRREFLSHLVDVLHPVFTKAFRGEEMSDKNDDDQLLYDACVEYLTRAGYMRRTERPCWGAEIVFYNPSVGDEYEYIGRGC